MIPHAVFTAELMKSEIRYLSPELLYPFQNRRSLRATLQIDRSNPLLILFFRELFIEDAKLFLVQADTPEAITATEAIFTKLTVTTVGTVLCVINHVTVRAVCALGAPLTAQAKSETTTADAFPRVASVVHVLGIKDTEAVIAIFATDGLCEVAIVGTSLDEVVPRFTQKKTLKFTDEVHRMWGTEENLMLTTV